MVSIVYEIFHDFKLSVLEIKGDEETKGIKNLYPKIQNTVNKFKYFNLLTVLLFQLINFINIELITVLCYEYLISIIPQIKLIIIGVCILSSYYNLYNIVLECMLYIACIDYIKSSRDKENNLKGKIQSYIIIVIDIIVAVTLFNNINF